MEDGKWLSLKLDSIGEVHVTSLVSSYACMTLFCMEMQSFFFFLTRVGESNIENTNSL